MRRLFLTVLAVAGVAAVLGAPLAQAAKPEAEIVRLPLPQYDGTLTPYTFEFAYPLVTLVYDTLLWRDAEGIPQPWLARSVKRSNGGRRLTISLQEGVRWHDGQSLTADDVAFTLQFFAARFHPTFTPQLADVRRVQALDRLTVRIDLRRPSLGFDDQPLSDLPILPQHLWQGLEDSEATPSGLAVGSGPYRLVRAARDGGYDFRANSEYFWGEPRVGRIRVPIIRDEERTYDALRRRKVDMLPVPLPRDIARELRTSSSITVKRGLSYTGTALVLNLRRPPFDRAAARRAVARALNLSRILRNTGPGVPAVRGHIHPASPWASPEVLLRDDVSAARRALARLELEPIRVVAPENDGVRLEAGRQVVLALRRAGATASLIELSRDELGEAIGEDGATPDFDAAIISTPALSSFDPNFLARQFGSDEATAPLNYSGYESAAFEALADRVVVAPDREARRRAVAEELSLLATDLPSIPLFFSDAAFAYRPAAYDGWIFIKGSGILDKRSFLPRQARPQSAVSPSPAPQGGDSDSGTVANAVRFAVLGVLGIAFCLALIGLASRWRAREKR
ncbi:MAG: ABC transporter substrate-binding protein [Solirubrobacterales bacterium]